MKLRPTLILFSILLLLYLVAAQIAGAAINAYDFQDPAEEQRFRSLIAELRCPKCQNQNIADSNAPLSQDLRQKVYEMMQQGQSNADIKDYLVQRYGDFITYSPPLKPITWPLWFGPFILMIAIAFMLRSWIRKRSRVEPGTPLDPQEQARLKSLLDNYGEESKP